MSEATERDEASGEEAGNTGDDPHVSLSEESLDAARTAETEAAEDPLVALEAKASENWDKYLRAVAELDNVRKRASRDVENARKFGIERFAGELLAVIDSLEAAGANPEADAKTLQEGSAATLRLLLGTLAKFGVEPIDPAGEPFDPQQHEAMTMVPAPGAEPGSIIDVIQKGYALNGRLVRPARVVVAAETPDNA
ncbi:MAG: nucleotide exchange factor GrpE [Pseudomonadota bacterium]